MQGKTDSESLREWKLWSIQTNTNRRNLVLNYKLASISYSANALDDQKI